MTQCNKQERLTIQQHHCHNLTFCTLLTVYYVVHDFVVCSRCCHICWCSLLWKLHESFSCVQFVMEFSTQVCHMSILE